METLVMFLNMFLSTEEELRKAFDAVEGGGFYDRSSNRKGTSCLCTIKDFWDQFQKLMDKGLLENPSKNQRVLIVYGRDGGHRYFIYENGRIMFSKGYGSLRNIEKAREVGFEIVE